MAISNKHPLYSAMANSWARARASYEGEEFVKSRGKEFLPYTAGQRADGAATPGTEGRQDYEDMKERAYFPDVYENAIDSAIGSMHRNAANIELPESMQYLMESASDIGENLQLILQKINLQQLITGRVGLLGDLRIVNGQTRIVLIVYSGESVINWDDTLINDNTSQLRFVVIDESGYELNEDNLSYEFENKYRALALVGREGNIIPASETLEDEESGEYASAIFDETAENLNVGNFESPNAQGSSINRIPFSFINSKDLSSNPDKPPLRSLVSIVMSIYRQEADYKQNLHLQSQDTLVTIGAGLDVDDEVRVGSGSRIDIQNSQGDAKFVGVRSEGISAQQKSLEDDYARANNKVAGFLSSGREAESGEALRFRVAGQTANLPQIAKAGAAGLQYVLRIMAEWVGANPEEVVVTPNLEFAEVNVDVMSVKGLIEAKNLGAPISDETIHNFMRDQGITEKMLEDELALIQQEEPRL